MKNLLEYFTGLLILALMLFSMSAFADKTLFSQTKGNHINGKLVYARCMACHSLRYNRTGPKHCGLFGRKAGTVNNFDYSDAMRNSNIVWNKSTLDTFLSSPLKSIPGTSMGYAGVWNNNDRADLISYLQQVSHSEECK